MTHPLFKTISLVIAGNILEFYDFLLFAHLGIIITPVFFPHHSAEMDHLLSLLFFGLPFILRPLGGWVLGRIADQRGRARALTLSILWATFPPLAIALLPDFNTIGIIAPLAFIFLRLFQGFAVGGEYPSAGVYLMEITNTRRGLLSSILVASGTVGSLIGWGVATLCINGNVPHWSWRVAFLLGSVAGLISYKMRKALIETLNEHIISEEKKPASSTENLMEKRLLTILIGLFVGVTVWLPMTYVNYYITKILHYSINIGLYSTLVALIAFIVLNPLFGFISDFVGARRLMLISNFVAIPLSFVCFFCLSESQFLLGQIGLVVIAASFNASIHAVMSQLFPPSIRVRNVAILFAVGLSMGGIAPFLIGFIVQTTGFIFAPAIFISTLALITGYALWKEQKVENRGAVWQLENV